MSLTTVVPPRRSAHLVPGQRPWRRARGPVAVLLALAAVMAARTWVLTPYEVAGDSMSPTLEVGSTVYVEQLSTLWDDVDRQDLVVFHGPDEVMLKRVVAVGGDSVEMVDAVLYVNGEPVEEPYVDPVTLDGVFYHTEVLEEGEVFVMGDNRFNSVDSRTFGPIAEDDIVGKVVRP